MTRQQRRAAERAHQKALRKQERLQPPPATEPTGAAPSEPATPATCPIAPPSAPLSEAKLAANRANAQHSTGPNTSAGKAASSQNSCKHGLYAKQLILPGENPAELDALKADLTAEHQPATLTEELLVNEMAEHYWRLRRARLAEARFLAHGNFSDREYTAVQRAMSSAERGFHKALKVLRELQKQRGFVPQKPTPVDPPHVAPTTEPATGFVPQNEAKPATGYKSHLEYMASRTDLEPSVRAAIRQIAAI